ncbi:alpha/beta fold hydrolase [Bacteroides fragilis]|jgi:lysophospholipase L1-like esterase/pimeloyl-ACP methyl ester carboxylesterase|uniref:alpha/beta fold hydrolase n=1 Tax=Bacteroides fragilis TaxID=817 RepID=UPI0005165CE4|nr:alpha/beta fold hydrolase [Bacteroides fragilis]MCE8601881.1 prolyl oligopeptidase family serine peptidase [Bacteroides fragilis]MCE8677295.1 prolyl oligopeptidase family serine peptidase [Bacteroides fragilis]MCZ2543280.1 GDSL-type esterase/lipase family protein [Bacteroides fragilis]MDA1472148.1 GDSL-type esterase/lipase family protein [Bacteroides fragilis]MDA1480568.1 GDSL-type esterase/lipase family protein [Bacteroides fragilis]
MKNAIISLFLLFIAVQYVAAQKKVIKIACIGNSITYGVGTRNPAKDSYPAVLGQMLGDGYEVRNFGVSARTMLMKGDNPYMKEERYRQALDYNPDIVTIKLGTNDTKPQNWRYKSDFKKDMETMIRTLRALPSKPEIYLCYPIPAYAVQWGINDSIIVHGVMPVINRLAAKYGLKVIDLHTPLTGMKECFADNVHPNEKAAVRIAQAIYRQLTGEEPPAHVSQPFPGLKGKWKGFDQYTFAYQDREAIVVCPKHAATGNPWIWRPAFFGAFASVDEELLRRGFHVAYYDLTHLYGSPRARKSGTDFYWNMVRMYGLSPKVTLEGFSRGGLFAYNWAADHPDKVACIYVDAPVCNVFSWPGRSPENAGLWKGLLEEWGLADDQMNSFSGNPIDRLKPLADAGIPVICVCGDSDKVVPFSENSAIVRQRYTAMGAPFELILKPGVDHHPHSLSDPAPVVDFIIRHQPGYEAKQCYTLRGDYRNSYQMFEKERVGTVAFLGGSITEMKGWRDMICEDLKQRFPYTKFTFIDAGIPSTGSTPGAFRLADDVLSKAKVDLLFVEAAVNDDTNGFNAIEQVRGMEGIVRHALLSNPSMDIMMLHFIYDPFIPKLDGGQMPDVILNHERVANHYLIPSVNLATEIAARMREGEFNWEQFGGTHPKPLGHAYYAATINKVLDEMYASCVAAGPAVKPHVLPAVPLDGYSYTNGKLVDIRQAHINKGWQLVPSWTPRLIAETRPGFVDVPMLETDRPGAKLTLDFEGTAVGIFCVSGPAAGILEYSIDGATFKKLDTFTAWSGGLYIPWVYIFDTELPKGKHRLMLRMSKDHHPQSKGTACQIRQFVVNE